MIVIADNSPLSALAEIGMLDVLRGLYGAIAIPATVSREAKHEGAPDALRKWMIAPPSWLNILPDTTLLPEVASLGPGEAAAISLAWQFRPEALVVVDDRSGRKVCKNLGIPYTGTAAGNAGLTDFDDAMRRLQCTTFRLSPAVVEELRQRLRDQDS
jgi:predicted nucleic acid-binding protein